MLALLATLTALPWLHGFDASAVTDHSKRRVAEELSEWQPADDRCTASAYGGLELSADLAPAPGDERVLAAFAQGIVVLDSDRRTLARGAGFTCEGSADELVALAAGDAWIGTPVIALAATAGGHNENTTALTLYRVGDGGVLAPIFTGVVEQHVGHTTRTGTVLVFPGGLLYRAPSGELQIFHYDSTAGRYLDRGTFRPIG